MWYEKDVKEFKIINHQCCTNKLNSIVALKDLQIFIGNDRQSEMISCYGEQQQHSMNSLMCKSKLKVKLHMLIHTKK